jgi:hypothetical protein
VNRVSENLDEIQSLDYSVLTVVHSIMAYVHAQPTQSSSEVAEPLASQVEWLQWRIEDGWKRSRSTRTRGFDLLVQCLAKEALRLFRQHQLELSETPEEPSDGTP